MRTMVSKIFALLLATFFVVSAAYAATTNLSGYGWAGQRDTNTPPSTVGIGWVNFEGVSMEDSAGAGTLAGYAWSPNIGWITFNETELVGCPRGECKAAAAWSQPNADSSINVKGWARACSVYASGCTGNLAVNALRGDWDGWIALSNPDATNWTGTNSVRFSPSTGDFSGFAWGDQVVGWLDFTGVKTTVSPITTGIVLIPSTSVPAQNTISSMPTSITVPSTTTNVVLSWYKTESSTIYTSCSATSSDPATVWTQKTINSATGNLVFGPAAHTSLSGVPYANFNQTYTLSCVKSTGGTDTATAEVTTNSCPAGQHYNGATPPQCVNNTNSCTAPNHEMADGSCATCPSGTSYDGTSKSCKAVTSCQAPEYEMADGSCAICAAGTNYDVATKSCISIGTDMCANLGGSQASVPVGMTLQVLNGKNMCRCPAQTVAKPINGVYQCVDPYYVER